MTAFRPAAADSVRSMGARAETSAADQSATPLALRLYRESHVIRVVRDWDDDWSRFIFRCEHDHIRVHQERDGGWRHDAGDIAGLARIERGEALAW